MRHLIFIFIACFFLHTSSAMAARNPLISTGTTRSENLVPFPKWTGTVLRFDTQKKIPDEECDKIKFHPCSIKGWREMIESLEGKSLGKQLDEVNDWSNAHPYIVDQLNWGMNDYWETPYEFMTINGDCEDYAISKYYSLRALGVSDEDMRIIIVQDNNLGGIIHAILGVYDDGELMILDNQIEQVMPGKKIYHYRPIYGINESWWWAYFPK